MPKETKYWLMKSEPSSFSIDDLCAAPRQTTYWDGVRNYQARNFMRDMAIGDHVLFYHSNANPPGIVGIAKVVKTAYPDPTQFDKKDSHYDPDSERSRPRWDMVEIKLVRKLSHPMTLDYLKKEHKLKGMVLLQKGSRLSVQPVTPQEWTHILTLEKRLA